MNWEKAQPPSFPFVKPKVGALSRGIEPKRVAVVIMNMRIYKR